MKDMNVHPLRAARLNLPRPLTQQELADFTEVSLSTIERAERGKSIGIDSQKRICNYFNKTPQQLSLQCHDEREEREETQDSSDTSYVHDRQDYDSIPTSRPGDSVKRRDFIHKGFRAASVTLLAPYDPELLDRFLRALERPSTLDERTLSYLEKRTENYWRDHYNAALISYDLLDYVQEHFKKVTELLETPLFPTIRIRLCSIAGASALLVGTLLFDMGFYAQARDFYMSAITAAQEATHHTLQAVGWGWMSLTWTYSGNAQEALTCAQEARRLSAWSTSITVRAWLAAIEAETQANLRNRDACLKALDEAQIIESQRQPEQDHYWTSFDRLQLAGYKGVCLLRLSHPKNTERASHLTNAQRTLNQALAETEPVLFRLRPTLLSDLAGVYIRQGEISEACNQAFQALTIDPVKSQMVVQRVVMLRRELEPWKSTQDVKNLDEKIRPFLTLKQRGIT
jgi:tetratricopeptide (TPR) repeat protein